MNGSPSLLPVPYREWNPPATLVEAVACIWMRRDTGRRRGERTIIPDNCADLIWRLHPDGSVAEAVAVGPMSTPLELADTFRGDYIGVRFKPGRIGGVLRTSLSDLRDDRADLADVLPDLAGLLEGHSVDQPGRALDALADALGRRVDAEVPPVLARALDRIESSNGTVSVQTLAREIGASRQHLARVFDVHVGLRPKLVARVARLRHAMDLARRMHGVGGGRRPGIAPSVRWSTVASRAGYSDQSHLIADFVSLTGSTPTTWLSRR